MGRLVGLLTRNEYSISTKGEKWPFSAVPMCHSIAAHKLLPDGCVRTQDKGCRKISLPSTDQYAQKLPPPSALMVMAIPSVTCMYDSHATLCS